MSKWIEQNLKSCNGDKSLVYQKYDLFKKETEKDISLQSFKRYVRHIFNTVFCNQSSEKVFVKKKKHNVDPKSLWEHHKKLNKKIIQAHKENNLFHISINETRPIMLAVLADEHIGANKADLERLEYQARLVRDTDGAYALEGGDMIDNAIKHISMMTDANCSPSNQLILAEHYINILGDKIIAAVGGNHALWTKDVSGVDALKSLLLSKNRYIPIMENRANIVLELQDMEYKISLAHKNRFNSSFNLTHTVKRMYELSGFDFDIGIVCHHHESTYEPFQRHGEERIAIRASSGKLSSRFSESLNYPDCTMQVPVVILFPDKKKAIPMWLEDGIKYLNYLRSE